MCITIVISHSSQLKLKMDSVQSVKSDLGRDRRYTLAPRYHIHVGKHVGKSSPVPFDPDNEKSVHTLYHCHMVPASLTRI